MNDFYEGPGLALAEFEEGEEAHCVSDSELETLRNAGIVEGLTLKNVKLDYLCKCGNVIPHRFGFGGVYVSCDPCKTNWILYFTMSDLAKHVASGKVRVHQEDD